MKRALKVTMGGVLVVGYAVLVGVNIYTGNWMVACALMVAVVGLVN